MKTSKAAISIICLIFCMVGCLKVQFVPKPSGDLAEVKMTSGAKYEGEFLFLKEHCIYIILGHKIGMADTSNIESIKIKGYSDQNWWKSVLGFQIIPAVLLAVAAATVDSDIILQVFGLSMIPAGLTALLFASSTPPPPSLSHSMSRWRLDQFIKYAKFPQGLSDDQLNKYMEIHSLSEIIEIK